MAALRFSSTRRGHRLRKSNSCPSLVGLAESPEDSCCIAQCAPSSGMDSDAVAEMSTGWHLPDSYAPRELRGGLRHVDSMELIAQSLEGKGGGLPEGPAVQRLAGLDNICSLPHVDSCELISNLGLGHYQLEEDFVDQLGTDMYTHMYTQMHAQNAPASTDSPNFSVHMPQLSKMRSAANMSPNNSPFDDALCGLL